MSPKKPLILTAALAALCTAAGAQAPTTAPPAHHGLLSNLFHRHPAMAPGMHPGMAPGTGGGSMLSMGGGIVGNRKTHVYHLPGDKGSLPSPANRVYFRTAQQALAAGYHPVGSHSMPGGKMHKMHT